MPTTPTLELCDDLVAALNTAWTDKGADDSVERDYFPRYSDGQFGTTKLVKGRKVAICPLDYDESYANHQEDKIQHKVMVVVLERYPDQNLPPKEWIDARVDWVWTYIAQGFDFRESPSWNRFLRTLTIDVEIADQAKLITDGHLFVSMIEIDFEEHHSV